MGPRLFGFSSLFCVLTPPGLDVLARHACAQDDIPVDEERLAEVVLDARMLKGAGNREKLVKRDEERGLKGAHLMVNVVVIGGVGEEHLEGVERQAVPAVVVHCLQRRDDEEDERLAEGHAGGGLGDAGADGVQEEALDGVVVERTECVGDVEAVVP